MKKLNVEALKINVENLTNAFDREESLWFLQDFGDDVNNVSFRVETPKLAFSVENIDKFKKSLQDTNYLYGYYEDYGLKFKANKENIIIDGNRVYIYEWEQV